MLIRATPPILLGVTVVACSDSEWKVHVLLTWRLTPLFCLMMGTTPLPAPAYAQSVKVLLYHFGLNVDVSHWLWCSSQSGWWLGASVLLKGYSLIR